MNLQTDLTINEGFNKIIENIQGLSDAEMERERITSEHLNLYQRLVFGDIKYFINKFSYQINYDSLKESLRKKAEKLMTKIFDRYESQNRRMEK